MLTTCSDVRSTYHLEFRFGYFASVAWSCDYVAIDSVCDGNGDGDGNGLGVDGGDGSDSGDGGDGNGDGVHIPTNEFACFGICRRKM